MKIKFIILLGAAALLLPVQRAFTADATTELKALVEKVNADIAAGKTTEAGLSDDLKQFDALLAEHKGEKTDAVAQILYMKATLYGEVLKNDAKAEALIKELKTDYPDTTVGKNADKILAMMAQQDAAKKIQDALAVGTQFPDFTEKDVAGQPLSIANYKGKVVLIDFWATWCPPCRGEVPNVVATYQKYHSKGFEIIGISLDQDQSSLLDFIKANNMTWQQFFDGQGWQNKLAMKYGINSIPMDYLLDGNGKIIGEDLRGDDLQKAVASALANK
ncbi:MAG TPA: TlpA disulfide reductase family protein [Candidatus Aquilonibacter sp.]|nr:TlpA disulfide reductase family protein [Candidatus Aquilonibacter sp.]